MRPLYDFLFVRDFGARWIMYAIVLAMFAVVVLYARVYMQGYEDGIAASCGN